MIGKGVLVSHVGTHPYQSQLDESWYKIVLKLVSLAFLFLAFVAQKILKHVHAQQKVKLFPWAKTATMQSL